MRCYEGDAELVFNIRSGDIQNEEGGEARGKHPTSTQQRNIRHPSANGDNMEQSYVADVKSVV